MIEKIIGNQIGDSNKVQDSTPRTYLCDKTEGKILGCSTRASTHSRHSLLLDQEVSSFSCSLSSTHNMLPVDIRIMYVSMPAEFLPCKVQYIAQCRDLCIAV